MNELDWLAGRFEENRPRLLAVAYRMLGSQGQAEDAVQEAWLRVSRAGAGDVANLEGWLTTITARVCLNALQAHKSRREEPAGAELPEPAGPGPEDQVLLADSIGQALLVILDTLAPAERVAFVLHDIFAVPFEEIAGVVDRSPAAARQLASRARRRVRGTPADEPARGGNRQRELVAAFLAASQRGDFTVLLSVLDPDVVLQGDREAVRIGAPAEVRGAGGVVGVFSGRAKGARLALIDGAAAIVWAPGGQPRVVFTFTITGGKITAIDMIADPGRVNPLNITILDRESGRPRPPAHRGAALPAHHRPGPGEPGTSSRSPGHHLSGPAR
jgi:RNA polymerase sigma factor (sigma-70 family)